jgi:hypothetical protein
VTVDEILATLRKLGKPQTAAIYQRHGAGAGVLGVLTSELVRLQKKIKTDHALALKLWKSGIPEARILALLVADPEKLTSAEVETMAKEGPLRFLGSYLSGLLARSPIGEEKMRAWMKSPDENVREAGYGIFGARLRDDADSVGDAEAERALERIEKEIHRAPNRAKHAMNMGLISIGIYKPGLRKKAIEAARRIGKVEVDHGETNCTTPDAMAYIEKAAKRRSS